MKINVLSLEYLNDFQTIGCGGLFLFMSADIMVSLYDTHLLEQLLLQKYKAQRLALLKAQICMISFQTYTQIFGIHKALMNNFNALKSS